VTSASASTSISMSLSGTITAASADVCEYSGLNTAFIQSHSPPYDRIRQTSDTDNIIDTTATSTTRWVYELCVAGALLNTYGQSNPGGGFTLLDGSVHNGVSLSYFEKMISTKTTVQATADGAGVGQYVAILLTLPAAPTITLSSGSGAVGAIITITGDGFTADSDMTATFGGSPLTLSGTPHTDANGHFTATFVVPSGLGTFTVTATDNQGYSASAQFSVVITPVPESPIGVLAPIAAFALALVVWSTVKRSKSSTKKFLPF